MSVARRHVQSKKFRYMFMWCTRLHSDHGAQKLTLRGIHTSLEFKSGQMFVEGKAFESISKEM
jgi:hypothetical protein